MTGEAMAKNFRYALIGERSRSQAVETKDFYGVAVVNRQKSLRAPQFMTLPRIAPEKVVHLSIAAIESLAIMRLGYRFFAPERECHSIASASRR